jgi:hypothetical protein
MLAIPGAVRAHHLMNVYPLPHLLVAGVALAVWRAAGPALVLRRGVAAVLLALAFAGDAQMFLETRELLVRTGGRGRWSESIREVASRLEADPSHRGISLDWGLHEPLLFLTRKAQLLEPIWQIRPDRRARGVWTFDGRAGDVYVLHEEPFDLFQLGVPFMSAAERLEAREPGATTREAFPDREGGPAIVTITLHRDHRLRFDGRFRFE